MHIQFKDILIVIIMQQLRPSLKKLQCLQHFNVCMQYLLHHVLQLLRHLCANNGCILLEFWHVANIASTNVISL